MTQQWIPPFRGVLPLVLLAMLALFSPRALAAAGPAVRDEAHLLDASTVDQLNAIVKEIHDRFGKDLTIRTFAAIPESLQPSFSAESKEAFYENWLRREARQAETNGVFVLIVKQPGRLQIGVGTQTRQKVFTNSDRDEMRDLMLKQFRDKKFDEGMLQGARFALERMEKNGAGGEASHSSAGKLPAAVPQTQPAPTTQPVSAAPADAPAEPATQRAAQAPATQPATLETK